MSLDASLFADYYWHLNIAFICFKHEETEYYYWIKGINFYVHESQYCPLQHRKFNSTFYAEVQWERRYGSALLGCNSEFFKGFWKVMISVCFLLMMLALAIYLIPCQKVKVFLFNGGRGGDGLVVSAVIALLGSIFYRLNW